MADTLWPVPAYLHDIASLSKQLKRAWVRWLVQHTLSRHAEMPKPRISGWPATGLDEAVTDSAEVTFLPPLQVMICLYDHKDFIAQDCCRVSRGWQLIIFSPDNLLQTEFLSRKLFGCKLEEPAAGLLPVHREMDTATTNSQSFFCLLPSAWIYLDEVSPVRNEITPLKNQPIHSYK